MPKTAEQEKLEGFPGHRPVSENMPEPDRNIPEPPKFLSRVGKRAYHELVRLVGPEGMQTMARSDALALSMVCDAYAEYRLARSEVENLENRYLISGATKTSENKDGSVKVETFTKQIRRHPAVGDAQDAWKRVMAGLGKFGLTPYDRKSVESLGRPKQESREDKIAKRRAEAAEKAKIAAQKGEHLKKVSNV